MRLSTQSLVLVAVLLSAGCLGVAPSTEQTQTTVTQTPTPTPTATPTPEPPISDAEAISRASTFHDEQTRETIDHYDNYGVGTVIAQVTNRTGDGVYVNVQQEYWYTNGDEEADGVNEATYVVNETTVQQVYR